MYNDKTSIDKAFRKWVLNHIYERIIFMKKAIITVVGKDSVGIIAKVCTYLADNGVNILDISQTITGGYFNMMMISDVSTSKKQFADIQDELAALGESIGCVIKMQREEIFDKMHRL